MWVSGLLEQAKLKRAFTVLIVLLSRKRRTLSTSRYKLLPIIYCILLWMEPTVFWTSNLRTSISTSIKIVSSVGIYFETLNLSFSAVVFHSRLYWLLVSFLSHIGSVSVSLASLARKSSMNLVQGVKWQRRLYTMLMVQQVFKEMVFREGKIAIRNFYQT